MAACGRGLAALAEFVSLIAYAHSAGPYCRDVVLMWLLSVVVLFLSLVFSLSLSLSLWLSLWLSRCRCRSLALRLFSVASGLSRLLWSPLGAALMSFGASGGLGGSWAGLGWLLGISGGSLRLLGWLAVP